MRARSVAFLGLGLGLVACSFIVERGADQCTTDADCTRKGAAFSGHICSADKVCVTSANVSDSGGSQFDGGEGGVAGECQTNQQCIDKAGGAAAICRKDDFTCVQLLNEDCDYVSASSTTGQTLKGADAVRDDATVLIGSLFSVSSSPNNANGPKNVARVQAIELAIAELMTAAAGLPPAVGTTKRRPVALLSCNDYEAANPPPPKVAAVRSAEHLLEAGVSAVIGASTSGTTTIATPLLPKRGVFLIAPSATSPSLTTVDDDGLLWRTAPSDVLQAIPLAERVQDAAKDNSTKKVAILYKSDAYGQGLFSRLASSVTRNGKPLSAPENQSIAMLRQYDPAASDQSTLITDLYAFKPDVVSIIGTAEGVTALLAPIEKDWPADAARPYYVVSDGMKASALTAAVTTDEANPPAGPALRTRIVGTAPGRPTAVTGAFLLRFEPKYGATNSKTFGVAGAYDAAYVIMYSLAATTSQRPSGKTVADGVAKLLGGAVMDVGPDAVNNVLQKFAAGSSIQLNGASSPLKFDLQTGESPADIEVWCVSTSITTPTFKTTPLYYDAAAGKMTGSYVCN